MYYKLGINIGRYKSRAQQYCFQPLSLIHDRLLLQIIRHRAVTWSEEPIVTILPRYLVKNCIPYG